MAPALALLLCGAFLLGCGAPRQEIRRAVFERGIRVAVLPFNGDHEISKDLTDALINQLVNAGYSVIERSSIGDVFKEQKFQQTGKVNPLTSVEIGRLTGVDFLIIGSVKTRPVVSLYEQLLGNGLSSDRIEMIQARWVDVQSGRIVASTSYRNRRGDSADLVAKDLTAALRERIENDALMGIHPSADIRTVLR